MADKRSKKRSSSKKSGKDNNGQFDIFDAISDAIVDSGSKTIKDTKKAKSKTQMKSDVKKMVATTAATTAAVTAVLSVGKSAKARRAIGVVAILLALVIIACGGLYYFNIPPFEFDIKDSWFKYYNKGIVYSQGDLRIHYLDVAQGDSIFIELPDGKTMLIDGGNNGNMTYADGSKEAIGQKVLNYIKPLLKNEKLDYCMLTHTDSDHCGGLDEVIASDEVDVNLVYMPYIKSKAVNDPLLEKTAIQSVTTTVYEKFVSAVVAEGSTILYSLTSDESTVASSINNGQTCDIKVGNEYSITFYNPSMIQYNADMNSGDKAANRNNVSPIMVLEFNGKKVLLTGDADSGKPDEVASAENNFIKRVGANFDVDVLKVAHHGGKQSTSATFLDIVKPEYAIISVGKNTYNHPTDETLDRLKAVGSDIFRTDVKGDIIMTISGDAINIVCHNKKSSTDAAYESN